MTLHYSKPWPPSFGQMVRSMKAGLDHVETLLGLGYQLSEIDYTWTLPTPDHTVTDRERALLNYLHDQYSYGLPGGDYE